MGDFLKMNRMLGWATFLIAALVYFLTLEPTASWWDCGEYIATAYKLQVGHPPGAPTFQFIGRFFSLFAFGNTDKVALMINGMSAISSALTVMFLFWTITMLARKVMGREESLTRGQQLAILGSGLVGALAYTFSDSFWCRRRGLCHVVARHRYHVLGHSTMGEGLRKEALTEMDYPDHLPHRPLDRDPPPEPAGHSRHHLCILF